jgi:uncharacterized protein (TIGR00369 family)
MPSGAGSAQMTGRKFLLDLVERLPPSAASWLKRWFVHWIVPFNRTLGMRVSRVNSDASRFTLCLPLKRSNMNVAGTVHGAAIMALAETVHGVAILWSFSPGAHRMFTKEIRVRFLKPARGTLLTTFALEREARSGVEAALGRDGACDLFLSSVVTDLDGALVAECDATYVVIRGPGHGAGMRHFSSS